MLRGRMVEHEGEFLGSQMWPEFVEFQNSFNYFLIKSFALRSNEKDTKSAQRDLFLRPFQRLGRRLDNG